MCVTNGSTIKTSKSKINAGFFFTLQVPFRVRICLRQQVCDSSELHIFQSDFRALSVVLLGFMIEKKTLKFSYFSLKRIFYNIV